MSQTQVYSKKGNNFTLKMHLKWIQVIFRKVKMAIVVGSNIWSNTYYTTESRIRRTAWTPRKNWLNGNQIKSCLTRHKFQAVPSWLPVCLTDSFLSLASAPIFLDQ